MKDHTTDAILATPPVSAGVYLIMGMSLSTWVAVCTIAYTVIMFIIKLPVMIQAVKTMVRWVKNRSIDDVQGD